METSILGNYTSSFHPTALLRKQILNVLSLMEGIGDENLWPSIEEFEFHKFGKSSIAGQNSFDPHPNLLGLHWGQQCSWTLASASISNSLQCATFPVLLKIAEP